MENARKNAASALRSAKVLNAMSDGCSHNDDPRRSATLPSQEQNMRTTSNKSIEKAPANSLSSNILERDSDLNMLRHEMDMVRSQAQSAERENEVLRGLLASGQAKPANRFRRAILMTIYPEEVIDAIGAHDRHDAMFVAVQATLFNSKSLPIQKITTTFSDGRWQEEMKFILDTETKWIDGRFILELKQKMFNSTYDPVISTASISPRRCLDWLHEGGEHSVQIEMVPTSTALKVENSRTFLFMTVKVAAERISSLPIMNSEVAVEPIVNRVQPEFLSAIESPIKNDAEIGNSTHTDLPGIPDESELASVATSFPDLVDSVCREKIDDELEAAIATGGTDKEKIKLKSVANKISLLTRWKTNTIKKTSAVDNSVQSASSTEEEEEYSEDKSTDAAIISSTTSARNLELAPNSNRSCSSKFVESKAARLSFTSMLFQNRAASSKVRLVPVLDDSKRCSQLSILKSLDSELAANNAELRNAPEQRPEIEPFESTATFKGNESTHEPAEELIAPETGIDPNFVAAIKGVSFANQKLLAIIKKNRVSKGDFPSESSAVAQNSVASALEAESSSLALAETSHATVQSFEENVVDSSNGCWAQSKNSLTLWAAAANKVWIRVMALFCYRKRFATVTPTHEVLDVQSEIEALNLAEERRLKLYTSRLAAKKLMEELETANSDKLTSSTDPEQSGDDAIESKLVCAISMLKVAYFDLPKRGKGIKITPVSALAQVMKSYNAANSTAHQRFSAMQHYLQSKYIDCESMLQIMTWIKDPTEQVRFFECMAMRVIDKQHLSTIACKFIHRVGTKFVALKTVERLLDLSSKQTKSRKQRVDFHRITNLEDDQDIETACATPLGELGTLQ